MKKRYKVLYLPTGEYITINSKMKSKNKSINKAHNQSRLFYGGYSLSAPRTILVNSDKIDDNDTYIDAVFTNKHIINSWIAELIKRDTCKQYNLRREYFEIMEVQ